MTALTIQRHAFLDPRYFQLVSLSLFLSFGFLLFHLDVSPGRALTFLLTAAATQIFYEFLRFRKINNCFYNLPSALITGLSLSLLLRTSNVALAVAAAFLAISSKFVFRIGDKHFLNPANFAIVVFLSTGLGWVSPGQWGQSFLFLALGSVLGGFTTWRSLRLDVALTFLVPGRVYIFLEHSI
jgi:Na+-transporting NADH:ubiquinone oxidoreductase subunit NqrB